MNQLVVISKTNKPFQYFTFFSNNLNLTELNSLQFNPQGVSPYLTSNSYITGDQNNPYLIIELWDYLSNTNKPNSWAILDITGKIIKSHFNNFVIYYNSPNVLLVYSNNWLNKNWWLFLIFNILLFIGIIVLLYFIIFKPKRKLLNS